MQQEPAMNGADRECLCAPSSAKFSACATLHAAPEKQCNVPRRL